MLICAIKRITTKNSDHKLIVFRRVMLARVSVKKSVSAHLTRPTGNTTSTTTEEVLFCEEEEVNESREKPRQKQRFTIQLKTVVVDQRQRSHIFVRGELPENTVVYVDYL